jgi:hypothetical protein
LQHGIEELQKKKEGGVSNNTVLAPLYTQLGDGEQAIGCFEKAYENHESWIVSILIDPMLDWLLFDPRFDRLLNRVGFKS